MRKALLILAASGLMAASSPARSEIVDATAEWEQTYLQAGKRTDQLNRVVLVTGIYAGVAGPIWTGLFHATNDECETGGLECHPMFSPYDPSMWAQLVSAAGIGSAVISYSSLYVTTPMGVAATMRQSKAVRALNPNAPFPWSGATAWALFTGSLTAQAYAIHVLRTPEDDPRTTKDSTAAMARLSLERRLSEAGRNNSNSGAGQSDDGGVNLSKEGLAIGAFAVGTALLIGANVAARAQQRQNSTYWSQRMTTTADKAGSQRSPFSVTTAPLATHEVQGLMLYGTF